MPTPSRPSTHLDDAVRFYEGSDVGYQAVADRFNVSRRVLRRRLEERGTYRANGTAVARERGERTRRAFRGVPEGEVGDLYVRGVSENELARTYGVTRQVIGAILRREGIPRRSVAEANQLMVAKRSPEENLRNVQAAHAAVRGSRHTFEQRCARAQALHGAVPTNAYELLYAAWLRLRGVEVVHQYAIGPYNCDLAADPVAVEIFGGHWHGVGRHAETFLERSRYILDQGWALVVVWVNQRAQGLTEASADYLVAFIEETRRDPSLRGEYRVIWSDGEDVTGSRGDLADFASVPPRRSRSHAR